LGKKKLGRKQKKEPKTKKKWQVVEVGGGKKEKQYNPRGFPSLSLGVSDGPPLGEENRKWAGGLERELRKTAKEKKLWGRKVKEKGNWRLKKSIRFLSCNPDPRSRRGERN